MILTFKNARTCKFLVCSIVHLPNCSLNALSVSVISQASGVAVSSDSKTKYEEVKKEKKHRYVIYHIKDEKVIEVESTGKRDATYQDFLSELGKFKSECRYCVFDFPVSVEVTGSPDTSSMSVDRLILMRWCVWISIQCLTKTYRRSAKLPGAYKLIIVRLSSRTGALKPRK